MEARPLKASQKSLKYQIGCLDLVGEEGAGLWNQSFPVHH
jgi:hypothetical protein